MDVDSYYQVKGLPVNKGKKLFLQQHHHVEHLIVVKGIAKIRKGENSFLFE